MSVRFIHLMLSCLVGDPPSNGTFAVSTVPSDPVLSPASPSVPSHFVADGQSTNPSTSRLTIDEATSPTSDVATDEPPIAEPSRDSESVDRAPPHLGKRDLKRKQIDPGTLFLVPSVLCL